VRRGGCVRRAFVALLIPLLPRPAGAQIAGAPLYQSLKHDPNHSVHIDYGIGGADLSALSYFGVRYSHTFGGENTQGPLRLSVIAGRVFIEEGDDASAAALTAGLALGAQTFLRFEPTAGVGWTGGDSPRIDVPVGIAIGVTGPLPPSKITRFISENPQLWLAPRAQMRFADDATGSRVMRAGAGAALGLELRWLRGFGVQVVYEHLAMRRAEREGWRHESVLGWSAFFAWF
jgi:hypothetical protein